MAGQVLDGSSPCLYGKVGRPESWQDPRWEEPVLRDDLLRSGEEQER